MSQSESWRDVECHGNPWKPMEAHGNYWKVLEDYVMEMLSTQRWEIRKSDKITMWHR